jgi:hypothetical protein
MISTSLVKSSRLIVYVGFALMQCNCSRTHELKGEVFIVTAEHESVKGLVEIRAFEPSQLSPVIDSVKNKIAEQDAQLAPISEAVEKLESGAEKIEDDAMDKLTDARFESFPNRASGLWFRSNALAERVESYSEHLHSAQRFFEVLPARPVAITKTDSDGKFTIKLPRSSEIVLCVTADRRLPESTEHYYWMVKAAPSTDATTVTLSNDNLATSDSPQSLIHGATHDAEEEAEPTEDDDDADAKLQSIEDFRTEVRKLENELSALESDVVAAGRTAAPSPTPDQVLEQLQEAEASTASVLGETGETPPPSQSAEIVILKQPVSFQLPDGRKIAFGPGAEFELISQDASEVHVRYMGSEQAIPISAVEFK